MSLRAIDLLQFLALRAAWSWGRGNGSQVAIHSAYQLVGPEQFRQGTKPLQSRAVVLWVFGSVFALRVGTAELHPLDDEFQEILV